MTRRPRNARGRRVTDPQFRKSLGPPTGGEALGKETVSEDPGQKQNRENRHCDEDDDHDEADGAVLPPASYGC